MRNRFTSLLSGLAKTRQAIDGGIRSALGLGGGLDRSALEVIEETLLAADVGVDTSARLTDALRARSGEITPQVAPKEVERILADEVTSILVQAGCGADPAPRVRPHVVMVVGVNGVGKTTTIGKLAHMHGAAGDRVIVAAADTYRAAADEQLSVWAELGGADFVRGAGGGDPAAVAYDALDAALARSADVLLVDTAGRLHTQKNLVEELRKIKRVLGKRMASAPHETLLVLDAGTGQNALAQARLFNDALEVTGIALSKLDGTARGGIVVAIAQELGIPVRYVGLGERVDDLEPFEARAFAEALMSPQAEVAPGQGRRARP